MEEKVGCRGGTQWEAEPRAVHWEGIGERADRDRAMKPRCSVLVKLHATQG